MKNKKCSHSRFSLSLALSHSTSLCSASFSLSPPPSRCPSFFSFFLSGCFSFLFLFSLFFFSLALWDLYFFSSSIQVFFILFSEQLWYLKGKGKGKEKGREVSFSQISSTTLPPTAVSLNQTAPGTFSQCVLCTDLHKALGLALMKHPQVPFYACKLGLF